ncbi:MAG: 23S rRNA (pseudouridine(1915)-N(3))-methyltransferase RlmH [Clostridia bacterium]|nr:23S rRNA (pseudouridine(1915)-N(3))-methyltransferase RlmH [Clostridia bacterium]
MKIKLICVGRQKESFFKDAAAEYIKRLSRFHKLEIIEIPEELKKENPSEGEIEKALSDEAEKILKSVGKGAYIVSLAIEGKQISSEDLADTLKGLSDSGTSEVDFIIGGSHGLSKDVLSSSDFLLSFSKMTFTKEMARVIFLEQLYRASKISAGETYHK